MADAPKKESTAAAASGDLQKQMDKEQEQGFRGTKVDPTPNENYTLSGVTSGKPTPETDPALAAEALEARGHAGGGQSKFTAEREPGEKK